MNRILLQGCQTQPLASYLKALGILRLVSEQADENATGRWTDDGFELNSLLDKESLMAFFLEQYYPTPVIAPWNGGSGYYPGDNTSAISSIATSDNCRFEKYNKSIEVANKYIATRSRKPRDTDEKLLGNLRKKIKKDHSVNKKPDKDLESALDLIPKEIGVVRVLIEICKTDSSNAYSCTTHDDHRVETGIEGQLFYKSLLTKISPEEASNLLSKVVHFELGDASNKTNMLNALRSELSNSRSKHTHL